jgi:hypothetical protein
VSAAVAAAIVCAVFIPWLTLRPLQGIEALAVAETGEKIEAGEVVRTNGRDGAVLSIADGSRVEMRPPGELALERVDDGIAIRLTRGAVSPPIAPPTLKPRQNAPEQPVAFEVASIRPRIPTGGGGGRGAGRGGTAVPCGGSRPRINPSRVSFQNATVYGLITWPTAWGIA